MSTNNFTGLGEAEPEPVYLDYNATTPLDPVVIETICKSLQNDWGNPSSAHGLGARARNTIERSRKQVADMINANEKYIVFMSGGTEANNVALQSGLRPNTTTKSRPHVIISNVEHDSVTKYLVAQEMLGTIELSYAPVDPNTGRLSPDSVLGLIKDQTTLISVMHANNETGVLMPIAEIGTALKELNISRVQNNLPKIVFHTDAAQSLGKVKVDVEELGVDYLTIVGHKFYGPRIGALFVKSLNHSNDGTPFMALFHGGGQERGFRPGTENTPMIAGLGKAAELVVQNLDKYSGHMTRCRSALVKGLKDRVSGVVVNFPCDPRLPNTLSLQVPEGTTAQNVLENCKGQVLASLGAACHSNSQKPSSVLIASGLSPEEATRTLRISVGRTTSDAEIDSAIQILAKAML